MMRLELVSDPAGCRLIVHLAEHEAKSLNVGLEAESHAWRATFRDRIRDAHLLDGIRQLETALASSRKELEDLAQSERTLQAERRKVLEAGSSPNGVEKKIINAQMSVGVLKGRIGELESLLTSRISLAGSEIGEQHLELMTELYATQEQQKAEMEAQFLAVAGELIQKMVRHRKVCEGRGHSLQSFKRRMGEGTNELVRQFLAAEPAEETAEVAAAIP
jgi:hypothetical protein